MVRDGKMGIAMQCFGHIHVWRSFVPFISADHVIRPPLLLYIACAFNPLAFLPPTLAHPTISPFPHYTTLSLAPQH